MMVIKPRKLISIMSHDRRSQITAKVISSTARLSEEESRAKHSIKLNTCLRIIGKQQSLNLFNMISSFAEPIYNRLFFDSLNSMDTCQTVPFSKHSQAF